MINLTINNIKVSAPENATILEAAKLVNINIPTLCHMKLHDLNIENKPASCRVCMVEIEGRKNLAPACATTVSEGMVVLTNTARVIKARKTVVSLLLSDHPKDCLACEKNMKCELQKIAADLGITEIKYKGEMSTYKVDASSRAIVRDMDKCILCRRCENVCNNVQKVGIISAYNRGFDTIIGTAFEKNLSDTSCTYCGQCVAVCPTGALTEVNDTSKVIEAINNKDIHVVVQTAPAVRVALSEEFGYKEGTNCTGKMVSALKALGFDKVFDTDFAADVTILEEATELIDRIKSNTNLPLLTSCCPGWIKFIEHQFSDMLDNLSTCKSPHEMQGALIKSYYAQKTGIDPKNIVVVSVMPCLAKKFEASREELSIDGNMDVDYVISTRELAKMIKQAGIDFRKLSDNDFDSPFSKSSGASVIFGASGGVLEAALRTAYEYLTKTKLSIIDFKEVRGFKGVKEAVVNINGMNIKVCAVHGLQNARNILNLIKEGKADYYAVEVMACPGGCIGGAGQPYIHGDESILHERAKAIYNADSEKTVRKSHENEGVKVVYDDFLGEMCGEKAHGLLHTHFVKREKRKIIEKK